MKNFRTPLLILIAATISACGNNFEWFPIVPDTTPPVITAVISGKTIFNNSSTHISSLPASVIFASNEAATIYYTINGTEPTTSSSSIEVSSPIDGPLITVTNTVLKFFGIDKSAAKNRSATVTTTIKSPSGAISSDTTPPTISTSIAGTPVSNGSIYHATTLPVTVSFLSSEPATIYYTTNGLNPTTSSSSFTVNTTTIDGPQIALTETSLKYFGLDTSSNPSSLVTILIRSP